MTKEVGGFKSASDSVARVETSHARHYVLTMALSAVLHTQSRV